MKKFINRSVAVFTALMMLLTCVTPVLAASPACTLSITGSAYAGNTVGAKAEVTGLTAQQAEEIKASGFNWTVSDENICTDIAVSPVTAPSGNESTGYTVTQNATLTLAKSTSSERPSLTVTAQYSSPSGASYTCETAFEVKIPYSSITVKQVNIDSMPAALYNETSSTLYLDAGKSADFQAITTPTGNETDDKIDVKIEYPEYITSVLSNDTYTLSISDDRKAPSESIVQFGAASGIGIVKEITLKKCVELTQFALYIDKKKYVTASQNDALDTSDGKIDTTALQDCVSIPSVVSGDSIKLDVSDIKPNYHNDKIKYTIFNDLGLPDTQSTIRLNDSDLGCTVIPIGSGTKYLVAEAVSRDDSGLYRNLKAVLKIGVNRANPINDIKINGKTDGSEFTIYTLNKDTLELSEYITTTPSKNYTDSLYYSSSQPDVASVDETTGKVTAKKAGTATITVTAKRGGTTSTQATCKVVVKTAVKTIELGIDGAKSDEIYQLPVGHRVKINITKNPTDSEESITLYPTSTDYYQIDGDMLTAKEASADPIIVNAQSDSGTQGQLQFKTVKAVRAKNISLQPEATSEYGLKYNEESSVCTIYKGDKININYSATDEEGAASNDIIEWRATVNNDASMTLDTAEQKGYITYKDTGSTLEITTKTYDSIVLTAYAIMAGQTIDEANTSKSITLNNTVKTTGITLTSEPANVLPSGSSYTFTVNLTPNENGNLDSIGIYSSNTSIIDASITPSSDNKVATVTLTTIANGEATVTIYAYYKDNSLEKAVCKKELKYTVTNNIAYANVTGVSDVIYNGSAQTFANMQVQFGNTVLTLNSDYKVSYDKNTNVGTATITISGNNNSYKGTKTINFKINPRDIGGFTVSAGDVTFNGKAQTPKVTVKTPDGKTTLRNNTDYVISYPNNVNAGTANIIITGIGNYTGTATGSFTIKPENLKAAFSNVAAQTYTGYEIRPSVTLTKNNAVLIEGVDYTLTYSNNTNVGTATITATGIGNYQGTSEKKFTINKVALDNSCISPIPEQTYTGSAITPGVTVVAGGKVLVKDVDYKLDYSNNTNVGTATVKATGLGNYSGSATASFTIKLAPAPKGATKSGGDYVNASYKKASVKKLTKGKKQIKVTWKKVSGVKGYQIQYSTSKKFTAKTSKKANIGKQKTTSKTIKKLKSKKTYYVRIRTYKTVKFNGKTVKVYSKWSSAKKIKTK